MHCSGHAGDASEAACGAPRSIGAPTHHLRHSLPHLLHTPCLPATLMQANNSQPLSSSPSYCSHASSLAYLGTTITSKCVYVPTPMARSLQSVLMCPPLMPQGDGVTKGLRKVTDDMKSKNRADRSGLVPQQAPGAAPAAAAAPAAGGPKAVVKGPPRWGQGPGVCRGMLGQAVAAMQPAQ
jgi:hypothetical protein